jgi:hypothetical protein
MSQPNDPPPLIDWAVEHARASLRVGVSVPEIESRLVARGLDPMIAEAAVTHALSDRIRERAEPEESVLTLRILWIGAFAIGCVCVALAFRTGGATSAAWVFLFVLLIVVCLWFGQWIGLRGNILVRALGMLIFLLLFVYRLILLSHLH